MRSSTSATLSYKTTFQRSGAGTAVSELTRASLASLPPLTALPADAHVGLVAKLAAAVSAPLEHPKVKAVVEAHVPAYAAALAKGNASAVLDTVRNALATIRLGASLKKNHGYALDTAEHGKAILATYASAYNRLESVEQRRSFEREVVLPHLERADLEQALIASGGDAARAYINMVHDRIDLDDVDQYEAVLAEHGPAYAKAKEAGDTAAMTAHERIAASRLQCPGHPHGMKALLPSSLRPAPKRPSPKGKKKYKGLDLSALLAVATVEERAMLAEMETEDPDMLTAFVESGVSLASIGDWWRRNLGTKKQKQKQAAKDAQKRQRDYEEAEIKLKRAQDRDARKNPKPTAAMSAHYDDETITAEMEDDGVDDPFAEDAEFLRDRDRLAKDLDDAHLERNIFKSAKDTGRELIRSIGSKPKPETLRPFGTLDAAGPGSTEGALLSAIVGQGIEQVLRAHLTLRTSVTARITVIKRDPEAKVIASDKAVDVATYAPKRTGKLSALTGTKILAVDMRPLFVKDMSMTHLFGIAGTEQLEIDLPLKSGEAEGIMAVKAGNTGTVELHLRLQQRAPDTKIYYTLEKRPLTVLVMDDRGGGELSLTYLLLVVPAADLSATDIMKEPAPGAVTSGIADLARWIGLAARSPATAEEELRALSLVPVVDAHAVAHVNHVLEEALRQHFMAAVGYKPEAGAYPIKTVIDARTTAPKPSTASTLLTTAVNTIAGKTSTPAHSLGSVLITELKSTTCMDSDPAVLRTVTSILSLLLCANGARVTGLQDTANRLSNLWKPDYNRFTASYFAFDQ
jgi:hypothetical protein